MNQPLTWTDVVPTLAGYTCLWQDLDGIHLEPVPALAPPTSIMWGWSSDGAMVRLRWDDDRVYLARCPAGAAATQLHPWADGDGRIQGIRGTKGARAQQLEQVVDDGIAAGPGPITFVRARAVADA